MMAMLTGFIINSVLPRSTIVRKLFSTLVGLYLQVFMYRWTVYHIYIMAYVGYAILLYMPRDVSHKAMMAWSLGYLSC